MNHLTWITFRAAPGLVSVRRSQREVFRINSSVASQAEEALLVDFRTNLQNRDRRDSIIQQFDELVGGELARLKVADTGPETVRVWLDVPTAPKFKDIDELTIDSGERIGLRQIFPVDIWTQAYTAYSYNVRVLAFSEYWMVVRDAATVALKELTQIASSDFYRQITRARPS